MRIVHVITKGDVGGAQTHVVELTAEQISAGHEVFVISGTDGPAMQRCRSNGVGVAVVPSLGKARTRLWQRGALADMRAALAAKQPDIVHAHSSNAGFLARIACRQEGLVCVYTAHGWPFQRGAALRQRVLSFAGEFVAGRLGDGVICLTAAEADLARRTRVVRAGRYWVVPNGLTDVPPRLRRRRGDRPLGIVMVARFAPPKQQRELVEVMSRLVELDWTLTLVGDGPELEACRRRSQALLDGRVQFIGHSDDVPEILADHDVMVLWSRYEGLPISLLEGMRAGLCCVASNLPGVSVLFGDPPAGLVADDPDELADVLHRVVGSSELCDDLADRARARYESAFTISTHCAAIETVYRHVLSTAARRRALR